MSDKFHKTLKAAPNALIELEKTKTAMFFGRVFGDTIGDGAGIIGDRLKYYRFNNEYLHNKNRKNMNY